MSGRVAAGGNTTNTGDGFWKVGYEGKTYEVTYRGGVGNQGTYTQPLEGDVPRTMRNILLDVNSGEDNKDYVFKASMSDLLETGDRGNAPIALNGDYGTFSALISDVPSHAGEKTTNFNSRSSVSGLAGLSLGKTYVVDRVGDTGTEAIYVGTVREGGGIYAAFYTSSSARKLVPVSNSGKFGKGDVLRYTGNETMVHNGVTRYRNDRKNPGRKRA